MVSLHRRSPGARAAAGTSGNDLSERLINSENKPYRRERQPVAIARNFGCVFAVFIREDGAERRAGLYKNDGAARAAAVVLNAIFAEAAT